MSYLKPQNPIKLGEDHIYPLTTSDQVILNNGNRLNSLFKKTIKENITLLSSDWSETLPYMQTITLNESTDDYNVDANVVYGGDNDVALNKAASCISYIKKNHKEITFYCLKNKPEIDIPVEVTCTCRNTIATVEEGVKLNFDVVAYGSEEELLADTPAENTIGIITDTPITKYHFSVTQPENMSDGEVWFASGMASVAPFSILKDNSAMVYTEAAKQMVSGTLVNVAAKIYINGEWKTFIEDLYLLSSNGYDSSISKTYYTGTHSLSTSDNKIVIYAAHNVLNGYCTASFTKLYDLSNYNYLEFNVTVITEGSGHVDGAITKNLTYSTSDNVASIVLTNSIGLHKLDISSLSGEYYIHVYAKGWPAGCGCTIDQIVLRV